MPLARSPAFQEAIRTREVQRLRDTELEFRNDADALSVARLRGFRSRVLVPLIQDGEPIGIIGVTRAEPGLIADEHVELLKTFADQAVIASGMRACSTSCAKRLNSRPRPLRCCKLSIPRRAISSPC